MGRPRRNEQWTPDEVAIVHCIQRCVRRAFLAGHDPVSGNDYRHRRLWIRRRLEALASVFGIDVLSYAILSNHMHVILRTRPDVVAAWTDQEVAIRWLRVFPGHQLQEHLGAPTEMQVQMLVADAERLATVRRRLSDISWFMRALSEPIARMANREDQVTGRFWEGRFKALRITDEAGLLACSMYVDLNPVRAGLAGSVEESEFTSVYDRIAGQAGQRVASNAYRLEQLSTEQAAQMRRDGIRGGDGGSRGESSEVRVVADGWLAPMRLGRDVPSGDPEVHRGGLRASDKGFLTLSWSDYLRLLRWVGSHRTGGPREGELDRRLRVALGKLGIDLSVWRDVVWNFGRYFRGALCAGRAESMSEHALRTGRRRVRSQARAQACFSGPRQSG